MVISIDPKMGKVHNSEEVSTRLNTCLSGVPFIELVMVG
jgi:hypothetical protein